MEQEPTNQEVDLLKLLAKIYRTIKRNIILVIVCPALGLLLGFLYVKFSTQPKLSGSVAQSTVMIAVDLLSENEGNFLCSYLVSADTFPGLSKEQKESIVNLSYDVKKETVRDRPIVYIKLTATVTHQYVLAPLQNALVTYFYQSEPVARQRKARERLFKAMIKKIDEELVGIEEMKSHSKEKTSIIISNPHVHIVDLYERQANFQNELDASTVYIVKGFSPPVSVAATANPKFPYLIIGFLGGIIILVMILFLRFFSAYYKQFEQETP